MLIQQFIRTDYPTVPGYLRVVDIYDTIVHNPFTIILNVDNTVAGLLSHADVARCTGGLIKDHISEKPTITTKWKLKPAVRLMLEENTDVLAVYDGEQFVGVVGIHDITMKLADYINRDKAVFNTVAHDLRNSITNQMSLNLLLKENVCEEENLDIIELSQQSCTHALDMLQELLSAEELHTKTRTIQETDLNIFIKQCLTELKGVISSKRIKLHHDLETETFLYPIDRTHFKRAVHNLALNAVKFSPEEGVVRISSLIRDNKYTLRIEDKGVGIPAHAQPFVFDQFSPASRNGTKGEPSTGLGLFFSKSCIEELGGSLWFESFEGEGTTFFIDFIQK